MPRLPSALASLRSRPGLAATVVLTLALGLGSTTTAFTLVDALLLRPLPYPEAHRLVAIFETSPETDRRGAAPANFLDWRRSAGTLTQLAGSFTGRRTIQAPGGAVRVSAASVSANFFTVLGVEATLGRTFVPAEDEESAARRVVLSDATWRREFGADPALVGQTVMIDEQPHEVVGVMPARFATPEPAEFWTLGERGVPTLGGFGPELTTMRDLHYFHVIARLAEGTDLPAARAEIEAIGHRLAAAYPATNRSLGVTAVSLRDAVIGDRAGTTLLLLGMVAFVLLIAGANTTSLMLTASAARGREFAIRSALGASRARLARQLILEGVTLAGLAGLIGLAGAAGAVRLLSGSGPLALPQVTRASVDGRILGFTLLLAMIVGICASILPAWKVGGGAGGDRLRSRGATGGSHVGLRRGLAVFQLGLSLTLLVGAGLLVRSFQALSRVSPGFATEGVLTLGVTLSRASYPTPDQVSGYYRRALGAASTVPGISGVAAVSSLPIDGSVMNRGLRIEGRPDPEVATDQTIEYQVATPGYFATMGIALVAGRALEEGDDAAAPLVAVISEAARRRYWPDTDPIGARIGFGRRDGSIAWPTIVGIVSDVRRFGLDQAPEPEVYVPMSQDPATSMTIVARTREAGATGRLTQAAVREIDPGQPVAAPQLLADQLSASVARPRFLSSLLATFAAMALLLAAVGLHGLLAQLVQGRTREIGVRLALGAEPRQMLAMVLRDAARLVGMGLAVGILCSLALTRVLGGMLFGISATDPSTFASMVAVLSAAALVAAAVPARRAARLDPVTVLQRPE